MKVTTIVVDPGIALEKLKEFRGVALKSRRKEDADFRWLYRAASSGKPILDLAQAFRETGLNEQGLPRLGFARANWKECHFTKYHHGFKEFSNWRRAQSHWVEIPSGVWDWDLVRNLDAFTAVPFMPPNVRPNKGLENYYVLFEVRNWKDYPADPFLLRHITGLMYVVVAEWELTDLERALLRR